MTTKGADEDINQLNYVVEKFQNRTYLDEQKAPSL